MMHALRIVIALGLVMVAARTASAKQPLAKLERARLSAAKAAHAAAQASWLGGRGSPEAVYRWSVRWLDAERDTARAKRARIAAASAHLARMNALRAAGLRRIGSGMLSAGERSALDYYVAEAKLWSARSRTR
jgi:hypothetical protein